MGGQVGHLIMQLHVMSLNMTTVLTCQMMMALVCSLLGCVSSPTDLFQSQLN
jgi:hypothetical protein